MNDVINEKPAFDNFFESLLRAQLITIDDVNRDSVTYKKTGNDINVEDVRND
jgi:hypothetical protein